MRALKRKQISVLLTVIAVLLWSHSILYARFEVGYFGLIHSLPVTFFIALAFLTAASAILWVSRESHGKLLGLQLLILISALWLVPEITGGSPPFINHAYRSLGLIEYIARQGHFLADEVPYLSWPSAQVLSTIITEVLSMDFESALYLFPLSMQFLYLPPLYVFLKNSLGQTRGNYCWAGAWLFYAANWTGAAYFSSAPGVGLLLLLMLLALITMPSIWEGSCKSFILLLLVLVVFMALATTHLLTALAALCIIAILTVVKRSKRMAPVAAICLLLLVSWSLTGMERQSILTAFTTNVILPSETMEVPGETMEVPGETREAVSETVVVPDKAQLHPASGGRSLILNPAFFIYYQITMHLSGSESHVAVTFIRLLFSGIFAMIGLTGAVVAFLTKRHRNVAISILAIAVAPLILIVLPYGGRLVEYLWVFLLAPMAYLGARLLDTRKGMVVIILCLLLIISSPLHIIAHYGNQAYDYFPKGYVAGLHFFHDSTASGHIIVMGVPWLIKNIENYRYSQFGQLVWQDKVMLLPGEEQDGPYWAYITRQDKAFYDLVYDEPSIVGDIEKALSNTVNCNLVYYNPDFTLYALDVSPLPSQK